MCQYISLFNLKIFKENVLAWSNVTNIAITYYYKINLVV